MSSRRNLERSPFVPRTRQGPPFTSPRPVQGSPQRSALTYGINPAVPRPLAYLLDKLARDQRRDTTILQSGHLNHDNINRVFRQKVSSKPVDATILWKEHPEGEKRNGYTLERDKWTRSGSGRQTEHHMKTNVGRTDVAEGNGIDGGSVTEKDLLSSQPSTHPELMAILDQFDYLKSTSRRLGSERRENGEVLRPAAVGGARSTSHPTWPLPEQAVPQHLYAATKSAQYKALHKLDTILVERDWKRKTSPTLALKSLYVSLNEELAALPSSSSTSPSLSRLAIYSTTFDKLIGHFQLYAPLLSEIKREYDATINTFTSQSEELEFLRGKVRKLLAQNENRLLLKHEREESQRLEERIQVLTEANERLKSEVSRKLAMYVSYIPPSLLREKKDAFAKDEAILRAAAVAQPGQDPLSQCEARIATLETTLTAKTTEIANLTRSLENTVHLSIKTGLESQLEDAKNQLGEVIVKTEGLRERIREQDREVDRLNALYREKEHQYEYLLTEFHELSETAAYRASKGMEELAVDTHDEKGTASEDITKTAEKISEDVGNTDLAIHCEGRTTK